MPRYSWRVVGSEKAIDLNRGQRPVVEEAVAVSTLAVARDLNIIALIEKDCVCDTHLLIPTN